MDSSAFKGKIILAPMADVGDNPFREICKMFGADIVVSEMISAKAVCYNNMKTFDLAKISKAEEPISIQIFGSEPLTMAKAANILIDYTQKEGSMPFAIDINMGCPVPKVVKNGEGSALMKNPKLAHEIVKEVVNASNVPVTVKMRLGWDNDNINVVEMAKIVEDAGASAVCVHARTRSQLYQPGTNPEWIKKVKDSITIPVIGNGDITDFESAKNMFDNTGCDSIAIARGALGNPFIFDEIKTKLNKKEYATPSDELRLDIAIKHLGMAIEKKGPIKGVFDSRKHLSYYTKGIDGSSNVRRKINEIDDYSELVNMLLEFKESIRLGTNYNF